MIIRRLNSIVARLDPVQYDGIRAGCSCVGCHRLNRPIWQQFALVACQAKLAGTKDIPCLVKTKKRLISALFTKILPTRNLQASKCATDAHCIASRYGYASATDTAVEPSCAGHHSFLKQMKHPTLKTARSNSYLHCELMPAAWLEWPDD